MCLINLSYLLKKLFLIIWYFGLFLLAKVGKKKNNIWYSRMSFGDTNKTAQPTQKIKARLQEKSS